MTRDEMLRQVNEQTQRIAHCATLARQNFKPASEYDLQNCAGFLKQIRQDADELGKMISEAMFVCQTTTGGEDVPPVLQLTTAEGGGA